ncbi:hypothetical protein TI04_01410, partial [Achromatium sp. WMS2]
LVPARNRADSQTHRPRKSLKELGEKADPPKKAAVEAAIADLETASKGEDKDIIESRTEALSNASLALRLRPRTS